MADAVNRTQMFADNSKLSRTVDLSDPLVSEEAANIFQWLGYSLLCEFIDIFGTLTNIVNIICFVKLGFKDPVNVSLLGTVDVFFFGLSGA